MKTNNKKLLSFLEGKKNIYFGSKLNAKYLASFNSSNLHVFYFNETFLALVDLRYLKQAQKTIKNMEVLDINQKDSWQKLFDLIKASNSQEIYFDEKITTVKQLKRFKKIFPETNLIGVDNFDSIRLQKNEQEIAFTIEACKISDEIFAKIPSMIKIGMQEKELKQLIDLEILKTNAPKTSFDTIVASGENSANPHWESGTRRIQEGDAIIVDLGQYYKEYTSDITRTFFVGKITDKQKEVYNIVLEAQQLAIEAIKPGIKVSEVAKVAREFITKKGYGDKFNHSLGHGIGIDIHEEPNLSVYSKNEVLEEGNIITIEPGIYLEDNFGIRIEDDILVTEKGNKRLNNSSKEIIIV